MFSSALNDILFTLVSARPNSIICENLAREIDQTLKNDYQRAAEKALSKPVPALAASDWIDRPDAYLAARLERRELLLSLVLGEFVTGSGRYINRIIDLAWAITEEATWAEARDISTADMPEEDNFSFETASLLAWTWHLTGNAIGRKSKYVLNRIEDSVSSRILAPFSAQEAPEWTKRRGERTFERLTNLLSAYLLIDTRDKRRWISIRRIFLMLDSIIREFPADGVHPSGIEAWQKDLSYLSDASRLVLYATDGRVDLATDKKFRRMADYAVSAHMGNGLFLNPDGAPNPSLAGETIFKIGLFSANPALQKLGAALGAGQAAAPASSVTEKVFASIIHKDYLAASPRYPIRKRVSLPIGKLVAAYENGFQAALTGGSRITGHEDAGNLFLTYHGEIVFFDTGDAHSRAMYHSCPIVNGIYPDKGFSGTKDVEAEFEDAYTYLFANIASAFPENAGVTSWQRTIMLSPYEKRVRIVESYDLASPGESLILRYVTPVRPEKTPVGNIRIGNVIFSSETDLPVRITPLENAWALEINIETPGMRGTYAFAVEGD